MANPADPPQPDPSPWRWILTWRSTRPWWRPGWRGWGGCAGSTAGRSATRTSHTATERTIFKTNFKTNSRKCLMTTKRLIHGLALLTASLETYLCLYFCPGWCGMWITSCSTAPCTKWPAGPGPPTFSGWRNTTRIMGLPSVPFVGSCEESRDKKKLWIEMQIL